MVRVEAAAAQDFDALCALLASVELPTDGLAEHLGTALVAREGETIVGCVALELYGDAALLRSLAVTPSCQGRGLGRQLARSALELGREAGVRTFCLLTLTGREFFAREFAFRPVARSESPGAVRRSAEFTSACPAAAQTMLLDSEELARMDKPGVLFLCTHNSARSQLAEALLRRRAGDRYRVYSAGVEPGRVHPLTVRVLEEIGIDAADLQAKGLESVLGRANVRTAIVVCAKAAESCPRLYPFAREVLQWPFDDPSRVQGAEEIQLAAFRRTRDEIDARIRDWLRAGG
jgi:arsenate reductase (thioredoxin)